jgi:hypothetical protein
MSDYHPEGKEPLESGITGEELPGASADTDSPGEPAYPEGNLLARFADVIAAPSRLMDKVASRPAIWLSWAAIFLVTAAFTWVTLPISAPEQLEMMKDSPLMQNLPEGAMDEQYEQALNPTTGYKVQQSLITGLVSVWNAFLLGTLFFGFAKLSGGKGRYAQALGVTSWSGIIPLVLGPIIALPIILSSESVMGTSVGLAALVPDPESARVPFMILKFYGDFPTWWGLAVAMIGFQRVFGLSRSAAALTVVLVWALAMLVPMVPAILFL